MVVVVVEFLSPGTEREDLGRFFQARDEISSPQAVLRPASPPGKLEVYERYLQVPHYIVYSRYSQTLRYLALIIVSATQAERPASSVRCNPCGAGSSGDWFKRTILEMAIGGRNDDRGRYLLDGA